MAQLGAGQAAGTYGTVAWDLTGPGLRAALATLQADLERALEPLRTDLLAAAQAAYRDSQHLQDGFDVTLAVSPYVALTIANTDPIFPYVEEPTEPHEILARNAPYLWFHGSRGWAKVKRVQHPGTKGRHALTAILAEYEPRFRAALAGVALESFTHG